MTRISLYREFDESNLIWLYSDPHFEDPDCKIMADDWPDPEEQVRRINSKVGKNDTLIILGDIHNKNFVRKLKGKKILVCGNHDEGYTQYVRQTFSESVSDLSDDQIKERAKYYRCQGYSVIINFDSKELIIDNKLFDRVYKGPVFISEKILLSHEPIDLPFGINIHGHCHSGKHIRKRNGAISINMCSNIVGYEPKRLDNLVVGNLNEVNDIHRLAIDGAIQKKHDRSKATKRANR